MTPIDTDDWQELRPIIEDGHMRLDATDPERLVLELATGLEVEWSLTVMVDGMIDAIENPNMRDDAAHVARYFDAQAKRIRRALADMEAS